MTTCSMCKRSFEEFITPTGEWSRKCKPCQINNRLSVRAYRAANKDDIAKYQVAYRAANKDKIVDKERKRSVERRRETLAEEVKRIQWGVYQV